jgi:hypothetical protein
MLPTCFSLQLVSSPTFNFYIIAPSDGISFHLNFPITFRTTALSYKMSLPSTSTNGHTHQRMPLENQRTVGGDMSIFFMTRLPRLNRFESPEQQQIKGLNFETIVTIRFPPPVWLNDPQYTALQAKENEDDATSALFSLNISVYNPAINPSDWEDMYFFLYGLVHPYALTWEVASDFNSDTSTEMQHYTIPPLIIRDLCYQP